jgi:hypothetical protein
VARAAGYRFPAAPDPGAQGLGEGGEAVGEGLRRLGGAFHEPGNGRVRGDRAEQGRAVTQDIQVRDVFAAAGEHHRQGTDDPALPVRGLLGDELRQTLLVQAGESRRVQEGGERLAGPAMSFEESESCSGGQKVSLVLFPRSAHLFVVSDAP